MRTTDCKNLRQEIDGAAPGRLRSAFANRHIKECMDCKTFSEQTVKLQEILADLGTVAAPGDFDFKLRARLAGEKPANFHFPVNGFSFGLRGAAVAALLFIFGSALFLGLRTTPQNPLSASNPTPVATAPANSPAPSANAVAVNVPTDSAEQVEQAEKLVTRQTAKAHRAGASRLNARVGTREMASRPATIIKASDLNASADFPIEASNQPVRVSLDNGRGNSRTISLPPVSFGSQRVMSQGTTPLLASARGSW